MFFLLFVYDYYFLFFYHSTRPNNNKNAPVMAVMDTIPKITIDQKISFRFFLLFSISRCFCVCFSRSFTISGFILPEFFRLFLGMYCVFLLIGLIEGEELGLLPRAPKSINNPLLMNQLSVVYNMSVVFSLLHYPSIDSKYREYI